MVCVDLYMQGGFALACGKLNYEEMACTDLDCVWESELISSFASGSCWFDSNGDDSVV